MQRIAEMPGTRYFGCPVKSSPTAFAGRSGVLFDVPRGGWVLIGGLLLSFVLGGGASLPAQGVVLVTAGCLWVVWPPASWPARPIVYLLVILAIFPLAAFLPHVLFPSPPWRETLLGQGLMPFVTPQPLLTLRWWLLWVGGISLAGWCCSQNWDPHHRDSLARLYAGGVAIVAVAAIVGLATGFLWAEGNGPFPRREEWGVATAIAAVVSLALAHRSYGHGRHRGLAVWGTNFLFLLATVAFAGTRAGLAALLTGSFAYAAFYNHLGKRQRWTAVAGSLLVCTLAFFLFFGSAAPRGNGIREDRENATPALILPRTTLTGSGFGNFQFVAPMQRGDVEPANSAFLLVGEGGWILALLVLTSVGSVLAMGYQRQHGGTTLRAAGMACAIAITVAALLGTGPHRPGVIVPALFVASLAFPVADGPPVRKRGRILMRAGGALLTAVGCLWIASFAGVAPTLTEPEALRQEAARSINDGDNARAIASLRRVLLWAPLDAAARSSLAQCLVQTGQTEEAWREFGMSANLLPGDVALAHAEGTAWASTDSARAAYAWSEALRRSDHAARAGLYATMLTAATNNESLFEILQRLYPDDPEFEFARIRAAGPEGPAMFPRLLAETGQMATAPDHLVEPVMRYMLEHGMSADLMRIAAQSPRVRELGWDALADHAASQNRLGEATRLHLQHGIQPNLPPPPVGSDPRSIERAASMSPNDLSTAMAYYHSLVAARRKDQAYNQLRHIMDLPNAPSYVWYLAARDAQELGRDQEAWDYICAYEERAKAAAAKNAPHNGRVPILR